MELILNSGSGSVTYGRYIIGVDHGDYWDLIGPANIWN